MYVVVLWQNVKQKGPKGVGNAAVQVLLYRLCCCSSCGVSGQTVWLCVSRWSRQRSEDDAHPQHGPGQFHGHHRRGAHPGSGHRPITADLPGHPVPGPDGKHLCGPEVSEWVSFIWLTAGMFFFFIVSSSAVRTCMNIVKQVWCSDRHGTTVFLFLPDILQGNFKPDYYLKHIQKDLRLAISMGDMANHPTPMAAAANEVLLSLSIIGCRWKS